MKSNWLTQTHQFWCGGEILENLVVSKFLEIISLLGHLIKYNIYFCFFNHFWGEENNKEVNNDWTLIIYSFLFLIKLICHPSHCWVTVGGIKIWPELVRQLNTLGLLRFWVLLGYTGARVYPLLKLLCFSWYPNLFSAAPKTFCCCTWWIKVAWNVFKCNVSHRMALSPKERKLAELAAGILPRFLIMVPFCSGIKMGRGSLEWRNKQCCKPWSSWLSHRTALRCCCF